MFFSVIAAYVVATAFAFCGVVNAVGYVMESQQGMGSFLFIEGMAVAMWPLAVAAALLMLIQIACKVERWMLLWTIAQTPAPATKHPAPAKPAPTTTPKAAVATPPFSSPIAAVTPPVLKEAPENEPQSAAIPLPPPPSPRPNQKAPSPSAPETPSAPKQEGLNFFQLD